MASDRAYRGGPQRRGEAQGGDGQGSATAPDYYSLISKAVAGLDRPDEQARRALYARARRAVAQQLHDVADEAEIDRQLRGLQAAIVRIEEEFKGEPPPPAQVHVEDRRAAPEPTARPFWRRHGIALASVALALVLALGAALYTSRRGGNQASPVRREQQASTPAAPQKAEAVVADNEKAPYVLRKQLVFYRTTHPAGTLVVSRSQRFLYLVRPSQVAIRYAIGVGPDCAGVSGLFHINQKLERENGAAPAGADVPKLFGSHALIFGERRAVHETAEPQNIGQSAAAGCFHSWSPDILDLYERVPLNERLVVTD